MDEQEYDVVVIGLGCVGVATSYELSRRGYDVLGVDQFDVPNERGSSHGESRIIRLAYPEGGEYMPMLRRSYEKWLDLDSSVDRSMYERTHSLTIGEPGSEKLRRARDSMESSGVAYDVLNGGEVSERFDAWSLPDRMIALHQMNGGVLDVPACLEGQLDLARESGLETLTGERVVHFESGVDSFVETENSKIYCDNIVITSGPWAAESSTRVSDMLEVERHVICEFRPENHHTDSLVNEYSGQNFPVWMMDTGERNFYGLPMYGSTSVKVGDVTKGSIVDSMGDFEYECSELESGTARKFCDEYLTANHMVLDSIKACPLTHSRDGDFIIDSLPEYDNVFVGVGMSGHRFKLSPAIGEVLASKVDQELVEFDTPEFSIERFQ